MIINEFIKIKISKKNIQHILSMGYDVSIGDIIDILPIHLNRGSHILFDVKCDVCGDCKSLMAQKYFKNIENCGFYACSSKCAKNKVSKTTMDKYGQTHYSKTILFKDSVKESSIEKYGQDHHLKSDIVKNKISKTNIHRYGSKNPFGSDIIKDKITSTNIDKYGHSNPFASDIIKDKIKSTNIEKYGVQYPSQCPEIKNKTQATNISRYGYDHAMKNQDIKDKISQIFMSKYGVKSPLCIDDNRKKSIDKRHDNWFNSVVSENPNINFINYDTENKEFIILCSKGHEYKIGHSMFYCRSRSRTEICTLCNQVGQTKSGLEFLVRDFISSNYDGTILSNKKIIKPYEIDIYLPDIKLAIEFNGLYWHNETNKDKLYHFNKTNLCELNGIKLIHIYEDDWNIKQDIVKSRILSAIGKSQNKIYARSCDIRLLTDNNLIRKFLNDNHLQGYVGSKVKIGMFYNNELVSIMTFGSFRKPLGRDSIDNCYELLRFCSKLNTNVIGAASKMFNFFLKNYEYDTIISYADRSWSNGSVYRNIGMDFDGNTPPNYYYIIGDTKHSRFNYRKDILVKEGYDNNLTEHQIMLSRNIYRIYDSGSMRFILKNHKT